MAIMHWWGKRDMGCLSSMTVAAFDSFRLAWEEIGENRKAIDGFTALGVRELLFMASSGCRET